jgi:subtilisin family serine protease
MCKDMPYFTMKGGGLDYDGHGTNVVGLIGERVDVKKYCVTIYAFKKHSLISETNFYLSEMSKHGVVGVNLSLASEGYDEGEERVIKNLTDKNIKVFVASGNSKKNLDGGCDIYPACHKVRNNKIIVVGSTDGSYSNYGKIVDVYIDGTKKGYPVRSGTSMSVAIATGLYFSK